jgi:phage gpG-like protein
MITLSYFGLEETARDLKELASGGATDAIRAGLQKSILHVQAESQRRTPVDTGYLKASLGGTADILAEGTTNIASGAGMLEVKDTYALIGTNVEYAAAVHEGYASHSVGGRLFMEKGAEAAMPFIKTYFELEMRKALK